jgi:two-component system, LuxR family, response regulator FixJ
MNRPYPPTIIVADDDEAVRDSLRALLESTGFAVKAFASGDELLATGNLDQAACLVVDVQMPGATGLEVQQLLLARGVRIPIIVISGSATPDLAARAIEGGAVDFLEKPIDGRRLLASVGRAVTREAGVHSR